MGVFEFVVVCLAIGYITFTVVFSGIAAGFRAWADGFGLSDYAVVKRSGRHVANMLGCPFCTGFWVTGGVLAVFHYNLVGHGWLGIVIVTWPAISLIGAFLAFAAGHAVNHLPRPVEYDSGEE